MSETKVQLVFQVSGNAAAELGRIDDEIKKIAEDTKAAQDKTAAMGAEVKRSEAELAKLAEAGRKAGQVTAQGMRDAATAVLAVTAALTAATVAGAIADERHQQALTALGPAYQEVERATQGTITATEAWQLQQRLLQSGLPTTGRELAQITRAARDYARATGTETPAAIEQLTQALVAGEAGGLRRFGLAVHQGATRTETFNSALRQLQTTQRESAPIERNLAEETAHFGATLAESGGSLASFMEQVFGIRDALTAVSHSLATATQEFIDFDRYQESRPATATQRDDRTHALQVLGQSIQRTRANLQATGNREVSLSAAADVSGLSTSDLLARAQHLETVSNMLNDTGHTGDERAAVIRGGVAMLRDIPGRSASAGASATANTTAADRAAQIARERANASASGGGASGPSLESRQWAALQAQIVRTRAEAATHATRSAAEAAMVSDRATRDKDELTALVAARATLSDEERRGRHEQTRLTRDQRDAELALREAMSGAPATEARTAARAADHIAATAALAEVDARIERAHAENASQEATNALLRERNALLADAAATAPAQSALIAQSAGAMTAFTSAMSSHAESATNALVSAGFAAVEAGENLGTALQAALKAQLKAIAQESIVQALKNVALGIAATASFQYAAAGQFFAAAGVWGAVGVAAGVGAAAIPAAPPKPATAPAASASAGAASARPASVTGEAVGPLTLVVNVSGAMFNEGVQESIVRGLDAAHARGLSPRFARGN